MPPTVGYLKDALALVIFATAYVLVSLRSLPLLVLQGMLALGFVYDATFTFVYPQWHCTPINTPTGQRAVCFLVAYTVLVVAASVAYALCYRV